MRRWLIVLILSSGFGLAQWQGKQGSSLNLSLDYQGLSQPSTLSVQTNPPIRGELVIDLHFRGPNEGRLGQTLVRPFKDGEISLPFSFDQTGEWGIWMRYGTGIDTYQEYIRFNLSEAPAQRSYGGLFEGDLGSDVPDFVQPLGFAIFGLLLALSIFTLVFTIRWVGQRKQALSA